MENNNKIIGYVTSDDPSMGTNIDSMQQRPMLLRPSVMQQNSQNPFPLISFLFPRIAMLLMMLRGENFGTKRLGVQNITQLIRDKEGRITEIIEFIK
jgi:hypothetical protein